jgi:hypothetical protein
MEIRILEIKEAHMKPKYKPTKRPKSIGGFYI